jgi:hypothetical protein
MLLTVKAGQVARCPGYFHHPGKNRLSSYPVSDRPIGVSRRFGARGGTIEHRVE